MLSGLYLLFSSGTVSEYVETFEWKNKVPSSFSVIFKNSYSVIYVIYYIVFHCSNQYTLCNSLHHPGSLRGCQGVVTPIGTILKAATGVTTKSPGHGGFFLVGHRVTKVLKTAQNGHRVKSKPLQALCARSFLFYLRCGHRVTAKFRRTQIVSPVAALSIAPMGVTTPWMFSLPACDSCSTLPGSQGRS